LLDYIPWVLSGCYVPSLMYAKFLKLTIHQNSPPVHNCLPCRNMPDQYDAIATRYGGMQALPAPSIERPSVEAILGDITGLRCLDLACGLGRWSKFLLDAGAAEVVGVDISELMIKEATQEANNWSADLNNKATFQVGDCSKPLDLRGEPFDLVFGAWLLNYAATSAEQLGMWRNICANLRLGGRFIGITPNVHMNIKDHPIDDCYGYAVVPVQEVKDGYKCRLTAYTQPEPVSFEMYYLSKEVYEQGAADAGLVEMKWNAHVIPGDERKVSGYWDAFEKRPHFEICTVRRPML
jgi:SAM-dependent methyltransferase